MHRWRGNLRHALIRLRAWCDLMSSGSYLSKVERIPHWYWTRSNVARSLLAGAVVVFIASGASAQYYKPFHAASKKLFALGTEQSGGYDLAFDSATVQGSDSVFHHFGALNDTSTYLHPACYGWGSPYCYRAELPLWSGALFRTDNAGTYWFRTLDGDTLHFDLDTEVGVQHVFYEDSVQRFTCVKSGPDTMTILGAMDSVFIYEVAHSDMDGQPIASALNGQPIIIGKALGLVRFFQVDHFPDVLTPLMLIGNKGPDLGFHRISSADVYDYQPGDIVQSKSYSGNTLPPDQPFIYHKRTILSRSDTPDSVIYYVATEFFTVGSTTLSLDTFVSRSYKHDILAEIPFARFNGAHISLGLSTTPSCAVPLWRLSHDDVPTLAPCYEYPACWVAYDTQGPPPTSSGSLILGVGISHSVYDPPVYSWEPYYFNVLGFPYYRKNGVDCGVEVNVGIAEPHRTSAIALTPNPTAGMVRITATQNIRSVRIVDGCGRLAYQMDALGARNEIDLSHMPPGTYVACIILLDGSRSHQRLQVAR